MEDDKDFGKTLDSLLDSMAEGFSLDTFDFGPIGSLKESLLIFEALEDDLSTFDMDHVELSLGQRRALVRGVFALIEGITYCLKQIALETDEVSDQRLSVPERMAINDEVARIAHNGEVKVRTEHPTIDSNVRFAFQVHQKVTSSGFELKVDTEDWEAFLKSIQVRHRITHPKKASDLVISDSEIASLKMACLWFFRSICTAFLLQMRAIGIRKFGELAPDKALNLDAPPSATPVI